MEIKLISEDAELLRLCREILAEISASPWTITTASPQEDVSGSDLCLWDYQPNILIPEQISWAPAKHLFLVHREDLAGFRARTEAQETNILETVYGSPWRPPWHGVSALSACSCADCDVMLQCLIQTNLRLQEYDWTDELPGAVHDFRAP